MSFEHTPLTLIEEKIAAYGGKGVAQHFVHGVHASPLFAARVYVRESGELAKVVVGQRVRLLSACDCIKPRRVCRNTLFFL